MDGAEARVDFDVDTYAVYWGKAREKIQGMGVIFTHENSRKLTWQ